MRHFKVIQERMTFLTLFIVTIIQAAPLRLCPALSNVTTTENNRCHEQVDILGSPAGFDLLQSLTIEQHGWCN